MSTGMPPGQETVSQGVDGLEEADALLRRVSGATKEELAQPVALQHRQGHPLPQ